MPRVTVIIPTFNWSSVLPYSIGSVLRQTFDDFELLVIGDGCTDDSAEVVGAIADRRVRWLNLPENTRHQSGPNNEGLRRANGEIVAYLGHDDLWLPHHLATLVGAIDAGADLARSLLAWVHPDGRATPIGLPTETFGDWVPPTSFAHRRRVTEQTGGWPYYRSVSGAPEAEILRRARAAGFRITLVPRMTGIKFPAAERKDAYRIRACEEQRLWSARIAAEPDLEVLQLGQWVVDPGWAFRMRWKDLLRHTLRQLVVRVRARGRSSSIDDRRRFKGL